MADIVISAEKRDPSLKIQETRDNGRVPGVLYGHHFKNTPISFDYQEFRKAYRITGDSTIISVELEGKKIPTLVHDVQYDPRLDTFLHVDFYAVKADEAVKTHIPLVFIGTSPAVKNFAGVLTTPSSFIEVKCLPKYLIHDITVDVSGIADFNTIITVGDLPLAQDSNYEILTDLATAIASVTPPRGVSVEEAEEDAAAAAAAESAEEASPEKKEG